MLASWQRALPWIPRAGLAAFVVAYWAAAARYPGGSRLDPLQVGYSHLGNFWCDLLDRTAYNGLANPGRPVAVAATWLLPLTLLPLWFRLRRLWPADARRRWVVPVFGTLATGAMIGVTTPLHDLAINVGALALGVALGALLWQLYRTRLTTLLLTGALAMTAGACDYAAYIGGAPASILPGLQKLAGAALLLWMWQLTRVREDVRAS